MDHFWDSTDSRLLVCPCESLRETRKSSEETNEKRVKSEVISFFVTGEHGVFVHERVERPAETENMMGVSMPYYFFAKSAELSMQDLSKFVHRYKLRSFTGIDESDVVTMRAMMDFMYFSSLGNLDEAFKPLKLIKSPIVWENMAKMAVKNLRLDVVALCLGNMGNAKALQALREANKEPEIEARAALIAVHLGMMEDAKHLLQKCERYDLLNRLYQVRGY